MRPKKPSGKVGPLVVTATPKGVAGEWATIPFSTDKPEIEARVFEMFLGALRHSGATVHGFTRNEEDHFDYTLELPGGIVHLDLTEIFFRERAGNPYDCPERWIPSSEYAVQIRDAVMSKSAHYGKPGEHPLHLLCYITHWQFVPHEVVVRLTQHLLASGPALAFENVFLVWPQDEHDATLLLLYPSTDPLEGHDTGEFNEHKYLPLNPAKAQVVWQED